MRVIQINAVSGIGSTGRICTEIADFLNNNGHDGFIAYSTGIPYYKGYKIGSKLDSIMHGLLSRIFGKQAYYSKRSTTKLLRYISDIKPNVVHLHNLHSNNINLKLLLNFLVVHDIPTVITLHDCWFFSGKCTHYTIDNCYKWQKECGGCPRLKKDNPSWFFDRTRRMLMDKKKWFSNIPRLAVVGVSDWITNEARKSFLSSALIIDRVYNWIDMSVFRPVEATHLRQKYNLHDKLVLISVASDWSNAKGLDRFIELSELLSAKMKLVLVGNMPAGIELPKEILHIKQTRNVNELAEYYSMSDIYIHLSQEETFGKTIAEALSCGTPAIVLNSTACPEIIDDSCGVVVNENSANAVLRAIEVISEKGKKYYTQNAIQRVHKLFNPEKNIGDLCRIYQKMMKHVD